MRLLVAIAALLAACGARQPREHRIEIRAMQYVPAALEVAVGDTVVWVNRDVVPHTVTSEDPSPASFDSDDLESQQEWRYRVTTAGELVYTCTYHPTMRAKLTAR